MARIYPATPDPDAPPSERKVFDYLRNSLSQECVIFHSRRFMLAATQGRRSIEGEADFVVLDPRYGYLTLEVKGGRVSRDEEGWISIDKHEQPHRIKDPGRQAQMCAHAIDRYLRDRPWFGRSRVRIRFGWGVVFPDVVANGRFGLDLPRELIIDQADLVEARSALERIFRANGIDKGPISPEARRQFIAELAPQFDLVPSLGVQVNQDDLELVHLTSEQMQILDMLPEAPRVGIKGAAGTGKTVVAMERARQLAEDGKRVLLLCYNRPLADYLAERAKGFSVNNFHGLCREMAHSTGLPFPVPHDQGAQQEFWESQAPQLLLSALERAPHEQWDAVIVDEGQDFRELWWVAIEKMLADPVTSSLWVFYDPNQNIFGGGPTETLGLVPATLSYNCRNTTRIARYASDLVGQEPRLRPTAPLGADVEELTCLGEQEMIDAVRKTMHMLVVEHGLKAEQIVVLSPRGTRSSAVWRANKLGNFRLVEFPAKPGPNEIQFTSLQRFKGLEADGVIVCEIEQGHPLCSAQHLYVGTSRAKHILAVARYRSTAVGTFSPPCCRTVTSSAKS